MEEPLMENVRRLLLFGCAALILVGCQTQRPIFRYVIPLNKREPSLLKNDLIEYAGSHNLKVEFSKSHLESISIEIKYNNEVFLSVTNYIDHSSAYLFVYEIKNQEVQKRLFRDLITLLKTRWPAGHIFLGV
jgi:hypothetical protein